MEPWMSTWLPSAAGHGLGRLPKASDFTDGHWGSLLYGAQEAGGSRDPDKLHVQREPSTAEVMEYGVKPGIKFWFSPLPAQGITNLTFLSGQRMPLFCGNC